MNNEGSVSVCARAPSRPSDFPTLKVEVDYGRDPELYSSRLRNNDASVRPTILPWMATETSFCKLLYMKNDYNIHSN